MAGEENGKLGAKARAGSLRTMTIEALWLEYKNKAMTPDCPQVQYDECKFAFYSGFMSCMVAAQTTGELSEPEAFQQFKAWKKEWETLLESVGTKR